MKEPQPYFREFDGWWYVQVREDGKRRQKKLAKGRENEAAARTKYHELMSAPKPEPPPEPESPDAAVALLDLFLDHCREDLSENSRLWYTHFLTSFSRKIGEKVLFCELTPDHVLTWIASKKKWSTTTKNCAVRAVRSAVRWLCDKHKLTYPLSGLKAPRKKRREVIVSPEKFQEILAVVRDERFRLYLRFLFLTGARPQEASRLQKRHCELPLSRIVYPPSEAKGSEYPRVIYLNDEAREIVQGLFDKRSKPEDFIFLNEDHKPWNKNAVRCRFRRMREKVGRYCAYHLRHSFATLALQKLDAITVSVLLGHSDASQTGRTYQHLAKNPEFMLNAAKKATG